MRDPHRLGSYRLLAELGRGGMADVFLAAAEGPRGSGFTKLAVVKKLRSHLAEDPEFVAMLMDEARITARLAHPNVVQLFEVGRVDDEFFLAMEFLEGQPLHRIVQRAAHRGVEIPRDAYYAIVSDVLAGLHHAHELSDYDGKPLEVTHRDVTPHNVFVTYGGTVKVVDFGIAKANGRSYATEQGTVKGKVRYMSPEQASAGIVDRRTDIFAAGVILWNLVTKMAFWGERTDIEVSRALCAGDYEPSPRAACPDVPLEIDAICCKALAFRPEDRYASANEMRDALEAALGRKSTDARKRLAPMMQELFADNRAKLRSVLEASDLTQGASIDALAATLGIAPPGELPSEHIQIVSVSVAPAAVATRPKPPPSPPRIVEPPPPKRTRVLPALMVAVGVAAMAFATLAAPKLLDQSKPLVPGSLRASVVASDLTPRSPDIHAKAEQQITVVAKTSALPRVRPADRAHTASPAPAAAEPAPPSEPVAPSDPKAGRKRALDTADPWAAGTRN